MKRYTLLTADMDGTVLNTRKEITPRTAGAIHQALADGWEVLFATGRCLAEVRPYLTDFPDMHYLLCHSGATVTDLRTGQDLCSLPIDPATVEKVLAVTADADAAAVSAASASRPSTKSAPTGSRTGTPCWRSTSTMSAS